MSVQKLIRHTESIIQSIFDRNLYYCAPYTLTSNKPSTYIVRYKLIHNAIHDASHIFVPYKVYVTGIPQ